MPHITSAQVVTQLGGAGVDESTAAHLAVVSSNMIDVFWATDPYPWDLDDEGLDAPEDVQRHALEVATAVYHSMSAVGGSRNVTLDGVAASSSSLNSYTVAKLAVVSRQWHDPKGMIG